jgi:hypothetical protein
VERRERERILGEWGVRDGTVRSQAERHALERDLEGSPYAGRPVRQRLRNFQLGADRYVAALGGPLPYMVRLRSIHAETAAHESLLAASWAALGAECGDDPEAFARRWREIAEAWAFNAVNELIEKHNRYYPAESRLPMDPRTGDFVLVGGEPYRRHSLDARWVLERFPPRLELARTEHAPAVS